MRKWATRGEKHVWHEKGQKKRGEGRGGLSLAFEKMLVSEPNACARDTSTKKQRNARCACGEEKNGGNQQGIRGVVYVVNGNEWGGMEIRHSMHHRK